MTTVATTATAGGWEKGGNLFMAKFLIFSYLKGQFKNAETEWQFFNLVYGVKHCS